MTIRFATPDTTPHVTFGSLNYGTVFKTTGSGTYYMKTDAVNSCGVTCNRINLSYGNHVNALDDSTQVIPVTLEAKEVQP